MTTTEKLLLILVYQLGGRHTSRGQRICSRCGLIGAHVENCELGEMEQWAQNELEKLWKERK